MSYARQLWDTQQAQALRCLKHPFLRGLGDGSLPELCYHGYVAQDAFYLDAFARAYAVAVARSPDRESARAFHRLQCGAFEEQKLHESVAARAGIDLTRVSPLPATSAYTDFLVATAFRGTLGELLAAMTPCMRLYAFLGQELARESRAPTYQSWIATYASPEFLELTATVEALLDHHGLRTERERVSYARSMELEHEFFEAAWSAFRT